MSDCACGWTTRIAPIRLDTGAQLRSIPPRRLIIDGKEIIREAASDESKITGLCAHRSLSFNNPNFSVLHGQR